MPLRGLHSRACHEVVTRLVGMGRELGVEALLRVLDRLHRHFQWIDGLMRQSRMEQFTLGLELPRHHPGGAQAWLLVRSINPVYEAVFEVRYHAAPDKLIHAWRIRTKCACIHNMHARINRCLCLLYTSPSPRDATLSRMPSSA